ncbi:hypothetical protein QBC35DRAFT_436936 [Podospora australis]|uniref:DUF726-domain-containing protein n=1 Tax=Podospora australis TaxID=1536484 RepID=A0AAN6WQS7_9PEZI|nr:hypothetical protein QBC35DRAFT_436936 [Podospora australis]
MASKNGFDLLEVQDACTSDHEDPGTPIEQQPTTTTTPAAEDMPPNGKQRPNTPKREADFSSLLNHGEKAEVVSLISRVTDLMQKQITHLFDMCPPDENPLPFRVTFWSKLPHYLRDHSLTKPPQALEDNKALRPTTKDNVKPSRSKKAGRSRDSSRRTDESLPMAPTTTGSEPPLKPPKEETPELGPRQQELKKEALLHFKRWQTAVHKRMGDISVKKAPESHLSSQSTAALGPKRGSLSGKKKRVSSKSAKARVAEPQEQVAHDQTDSRVVPVPITVEADPSFWQLYPPTPNPLSSLPPEKRCMLLHALFLLLISLESYGAYTRVLLLNLTASLHLPHRILAENETRLGQAFSNCAKDIPVEEALRKAEESKSSRRKGPGAIFGATIGAGNLAAPLLAAGIGSIPSGMGIGIPAAASLLGTLAENGLVAGNLLGMYGTRAGGKTMEQHTKDVSDVAFIPLRGVISDETVKIGEIAPEHRRLRVVVCVGGWLPNKGNVKNPWKCMGEQNEVYVVRWELENLGKLAASLETLVKSAAWSEAKKEIIARTMYTSLIDARWPAALLKLSKIVDNPWNTAMVRADKLGTILADVLMSKAHGERGASLVGFSLGARAIYTCLATLAERRAFGLVENVVMMGTPAPSETAIWCAMRSVVTGRLINVYSQNDYILGFLSRMCSVEYGVAGLQRIVGVDSIENLDVSAKVSGHLRYQYLVGSILQHINWEDIDKDQVTKDVSDMTYWEEAIRKLEARRNAIEAGKPDIFKKENKDGEVGVIRTRMRKKNRK